MIEVQVDEHPLLEAGFIEAVWPAPLGMLSGPDWLVALQQAEHTTPLPAVTDRERLAVRELLRHGGFKPAGRGKPCAEYIRAAAEKGVFPQINAAVDATNVACLHGGLPVSTVDVARLALPLRIGIAPAGASYVFNASGQEIALGGLLCLLDADGPCSNAVKDAQRAKTTPETRRTLTVVWGTRALVGQTAAVTAWLEALFVRLGATVQRG
jgi:DNA/RNA-binding domain of Phe-tRNA-synthetase-like protein